MQKIRKLRGDTGLLISATMTLVIVFIIIEFFAFALLSLKELSKDYQNSSQIIVYLNDVEDEVKKDFSKKLIQLPGVRSIRYESKEVALKAAVLELGVEVNENENPLNDAFFVYLNENVDLEQMKTSLLNMKEISAVDFRTKALETSINFSKGIESISIKLSVIFVVIGLLMIYNIISFDVKSRKKEISDDLLAGISTKQLKTMFFVESIKLIIISAFISFLVYQILNRIIIGNIRQIIPSYKMSITIFTEITLILILVIVAVFIAFIISNFAMNRHFVLNKKEEVEKTDEILETSKKEEIESYEEGIEELFGDDYEK